MSHAVPDDVPGSEVDVEEDQTLNLTVYAEEDPELGDVDEVLANPTEEELAMGQQFGESIDVDDDDDAGVAVE
jgi:hypothetical protein